MITRTTPGTKLLARHDYDNASFPFATNDWGNPQGAFLSIHTGRLLYDGTFVNDDSQIVHEGTELRTERLVYVDMAMFNGEAWAYVAAAIVDPPQPYDGLLHRFSIDRGAGETTSLREYVDEINTISDGIHNTAAAKAINTRYRFTIARDGANLASHDFYENASFALIATALGGVPAYSGLGMTDRSGGIYRYIDAPGRYATIEGVPIGSTVEVRTLADVVLATSGVSVTGIVTVDMLAVPLETARKMVILSSGSVELDVYTTGVDEIIEPGETYISDIFVVNIDTPTITVDEITTVSARLNGSIFSGGSGVHAASQWQVQLLGEDWSTPVIDTGLDPVNLLTYIATLNSNTYYEARVRYEDDEDLLSDWSEPVVFQTLIDISEITPCDVIEPVYAEVSQDGRASCSGISPNYLEDDSVAITFDDDSGCGGVPPSTETC